MKIFEIDYCFAHGNRCSRIFLLFTYYQAALVASRRALTERKGALETVHEILERLEAHLKANGQFTVCA